MASDRSKKTGASRRSFLGPVLGALLLILVGTVLQLDVLGYAHLNSDNIWFMSVIAEGLWNAAATPMEMPSLREIVSFWPLLIVFSYHKSGTSLLLHVMNKVSERLGLTAVNYFGLVDHIALDADIVLLPHSLLAQSALVELRDRPYRAIRMIRAMVRMVPALWVVAVY